MAKLPHKSGMSPVDLARHVLRSHHALGGTAGRQHFESGGDDRGSTTADTGPAQPSEKEYLDALNAAFQANFGRAYNPKTDSWWMDQLKAGKEDLANLQTDVMSGAQGADKVRAQYLPTLQNLYQQDFGRAYNPATDSWWLDQLASGKEDPANLARDVLAGAQGRDKLYVGTYTTPIQNQVVTPLQQNPSRYVGIPSGGVNYPPVSPPPAVTPAPVTGTPITGTPATGTPATQQYGTYAGQGTTPSAPVPSTAQSYVGTPWNINAVQNYMSPNPLLGYQFNAPSLISAPLMNQQLANAGGPGISGVPSSNVQAPAYTPPATDMSAYTNAYNSVMTNPNYTYTTPVNKTDTTITKPDTTITKPDTTITKPGSTVVKPSADETNFKTYDPLLQQDYQLIFGRTPDTAGEQYWANQLASGAVTKDNLIKSLIAGAQGADIQKAQEYQKVNAGPSINPTTSTTQSYTPVNIPVSSYTYTPQSQLPSQSQGYLDNLAAVRANPVAENALQGAAAEGVPGFDVRKRGGRTGKNKSGTGALVKKALMVVSTYKPKRSKQAG